VVGDSEVGIKEVELVLHQLGATVLPRFNTLCNFSLGGGGGGQDTDSKERSSNTFRGSGSNDEEAEDSQLGVDELRARSRAGGGATQARIQNTQVTTLHQNLLLLLYLLVFTWSVHVLYFAENRFRMLRDFFLLKDAAGVVASIPRYGESSFSTVATSAGDTPILFCFKRWRHLGSLPVW
jgi:hypothetical protein